MRRWIIGGALALAAAVSPAKADVITSGQYIVTEEPSNGTMFFGFNGTLTNIDFSRLDGFGDPYLYSYSINATVNGNNFLDFGNINCPAQLQPGCSHQGPHATFLFLPVTLGEIINVSVHFGANWDTDPMYLEYRGGQLGPVGSVAAVPEPSTWAMLLIGFAGVGFAAYRRQVKRPQNPPLAVVCR